MTALALSTQSAVAVQLCRLAIAVSAAFLSAAGDGLNTGVALVALLLTLAPACLIRNPWVRDSAAVVNALLLAAHIVLGMQLELYETSRLYDKVMHTVGSAAIAVILMIALRNYYIRERNELPMALLVLLVFAVTLSLGTLWELFEFSIDRTGMFSAQRSLEDTMFDLLADALGALLSLLLIAVMSFYQAIIEVLNITRGT